jgi:hypothetical protein
MVAHFENLTYGAFKEQELPLDESSTNVTPILIML